MIDSHLRPPHLTEDQWAALLEALPPPELTRLLQEEQDPDARAWRHLRLMGFTPKLTPEQETEAAVYWRHLEELLRSGAIRLEPRWIVGERTGALHLMEITLRSAEQEEEQEL